MKSLSQNNGLFVGVSAGANVFVAKEVAEFIKLDNCYYSM